MKKISYNTPYETTIGEHLQGQCVFFEAIFASSEHGGEENLDLIPDQDLYRQKSTRLSESPEKFQFYTADRSTIGGNNQVHG